MINIDDMAFAGNDITIVVPYGTADAWVEHYGGNGISLFDANSVTFKDAAAADVNTLTPNSLINLSFISPEAELKIVLDENEVELLMQANHILQII